jgi:diphthine synthase
VLIGLGLFDEKDISLKGLEEAKNSSKVYAEVYTSIWKGSFKKLEKMVGKKISLLERKDLEEEFEKILEEAKEEKIAVFVPGDPLIATTHSSLILEARKRGVGTKIIHSSSIISAIAECGLHIYKFGKILTIPLPEKTKILPQSVYDGIKENLGRGLHTLCLLDVDVESKKFLEVNEALGILMEMENIFNKKVVSLSTKILVLSEIGSDKPKIVYDKIENLLKQEFNLPAVIIIPGELHFTEKEFLNSI